MNRSLSFWMLEKTGRIQPRILIIDVIDVDALLRDAQFCILMFEKKKKYHAHIQLSEVQ